MQKSPKQKRSESRPKVAFRLPSRPPSRHQAEWSAPAGPAQSARTRTSAQLADLSQRLSIYTLPPTDHDEKRMSRVAQPGSYISRSPVASDVDPTSPGPQTDVGGRDWPTRTTSRGCAEQASCVTGGGGGSGGGGGGGEPGGERAPRASMLPPSMAKTKACLAKATTASGGVAEEYLQAGIAAHEQGELERAAALFERSARENGGCGAGMLMWGLSLRHGWGCAVNEDVAFQWLQKSAETVVEDLEKFMGGKKYQQGQTEGNEDKLAFKSDIVLSVYELGMCYMRGWGCLKDKPLAISYFELAARLGDSDAQQELGFCYEHGKGAKKDLKAAARYYRMASEQGVEMMGCQWIWKDKYDE